MTVIPEEFNSEIVDYVNQKKINKVLAEAEKPSLQKVKEIIEKALALEGLTPQEAAVLLQVKDEGLIKKFLEAARTVKEKIYGKRLVVFAPLYFANLCENNCLYCGFRHENDQIDRQKLSQSEIVQEVKALEKEGHKRLLVLTGESEATDLDYVVESIKTCYQTRTDNGGEIRRINVEIAPLTIQQFKKLKKAEIGTYTCFQETYHRPTYEQMHPSGAKANFDWRLSVMDRAQEAGIDDVGIGALFGLYDYRFEVIGLLLHAQYLDQKFGVGPHTISVPRLNPAVGVPVESPPAPVSETEFKKLVAVLRLAVPYTGLILTTRESESIRNELFLHGVSQISAGSRTTPGGYQKAKEREHNREQFSLHDLRPLEEIIKEISAKNYIPSFCTACYRLGRTGEDFMELAKPGEIQQYCKPNAMLTFKEYLVNNAGKETARNGEDCLNHHLKQLEKSDSNLAKKVRTKLQQIEKGGRDVYI